MRLDEACEATFARHETFHPRLGWFRKAFLAAARNEGGFFLADNAPTRLGVGKNMVRSIRFWGTAAHLITDVPNPDRPRIPNTVTTNLGVGLLSPEGLDPFMEDIASWWVHWMLLAPGCRLPVWWVLVNEMNVIEFDDELAERICFNAIEASTFDTPHVSSIAKDITAFLRTYTDNAAAARGRFDDQFGCPLRDLHLVTSRDGRHRFATDPGADLPGEVVLAAILDYVALTGSTAHTVSLSRLATEPGSPARAFRISEEQMADLIDPIARRSRTVTLSAPAGTMQLGWRGNAADLAHRLLCAHFDADPDRPAVAGLRAREANPDREIELLIIEYGRGVVL